MENSDRVALLACLWFAGWTMTGDEVGKYVFACPGTGAVLGFLFALVSVMSWPWVLPDFIDRWLYEPEPDVRRLHKGSWRVMRGAMFPQHDVFPRQTGMHRVFIVAGLWFLFWMIVCSAISGYLGGSTGERNEGLYAGFFNGAWWALLTSFAWPWLMPSALERWMYRP